MKFSCQKNLILKEISNALDFAALRNESSITSSVYLSLSFNNLTIKTTDTKSCYISEITVSGEEDGIVAVLCDKFLEIIKNMPEGEIIFSEDDINFLISSADGFTKFGIKKSDFSEFPLIEIPGNDTFFKISQNELCYMINQVIFAVCDENAVNYSMTGVLFEKENETNSLIMVATDGRRLSCVKKKIEDNLPDFNKVIIPAKFLNIIKKISLNEGFFEISINNTMVCFKFNSTVVMSNLIKNDYPEYKRVIPQNQTKCCIVKIKMLEDAIRRISIFSENKYKKIFFKFSEDNLEIYSDDNAVASGNTKINCSYSNEELISAFNFTYLLGPIKAMSGEEVKINFTEAGNPFKLESTEDSDSVHVIMPMKAN